MFQPRISQTRGIDVSILQYSPAEQKSMISFFNYIDLDDDYPNNVAIQWLGARGFFAPTMHVPGILLKNAQPSAGSRGWFNSSMRHWMKTCLPMT